MDTEDCEQRAGVGGEGMRPWWRRLGGPAPSQTDLPLQRWAWNTHPSHGFCGNGPQRRPSLTSARADGARRAQVALNVFPAEVSSTGWVYGAGNLVRSDPVPLFRDGRRWVIAASLVRRVVTAEAAYC